MTDESSIRLPTPSDVIHGPVRQITRLGRRFNGWGRWLVFGGLTATAGILLLALARSDVPEPLRDAVVALGLGASTLGTLMWLASVLLRSQLCHYHASKFEAELRRVQLVAECERFVLGIDTAAIGRLAAQLQGIETLLPSFRAAIELNREVMLRRLGEIEAQRQADLTLMRENGEKLFESVHDHLDRVERAREVDAGLVRELVAKQLDERELLRGLNAGTLKVMGELAARCRTVENDVANMKMAQHVLEQSAAAHMVPSEDDPGVVDLEDVRALKRIDEKIRQQRSPEG